MLTALGASEEEDHIFRYLATTVSVTDEEIQRATGMPLERIREALAALEARGLVGTTGDVPTRYVAASPGAVEAMIANQLRELRDAQGTLDRLTTKYRAEHLARESASAFEILRGQEALRQRSMHMLHSARVQVLNMIKPPIIAVRSQDRVVPSDAASGRVIFETSSLGEPDALDAVQAGLRPNDEVRVHTKLPAKMLIVESVTGPGAAHPARHDAGRRARPRERHARLARRAVRLRVGRVGAAARGQRQLPAPRTATRRFPRRTGGCSHCCCPASPTRRSPRTFGSACAPSSARCTA
jgi:hypothetical protein